RDDAARRHHRVIAEVRHGGMRAFRRACQARQGRACPLKPDRVNIILREWECQYLNYYRAGGLAASASLTGGDRRQETLHPRHFMVGCLSEIAFLWLSGEEAVSDLQRAAGRGAG